LLLRHGRRRTVSVRPAARGGTPHGDAFLPPSAQCGNLSWIILSSVVNAARRTRMMPTAPVTMPVMAIPPPLYICGALRILFMPMMPSTTAAIASGLLSPGAKHEQKHVGIERMPQIIAAIARPLNLGAPIIIPGGPPNPPGGGPKPPGGGP